MPWCRRTTAWTSGPVGAPDLAIAGPVMRGVVMWQADPTPLSWFAGGQEAIRLPGH